MNKQYSKVNDNTKCKNCTGCNLLEQHYFKGKLECKDFHQAFTDEELAKRLRDSMEYGSGSKS